MDNLGHLWAIGYDTPARAGAVRDRLKQLEPNHFLILADWMVVVRQRDGTFHFERESQSPELNILGCGLLGALLGLVVLQPLAGAAIGGALGAVGSLVASHVRIDPDFIGAVQGLMQPGTSVLFLLANATDEVVVLHQIRGLGGTILKTNVELAWAERVRQALAGRART
jgi:uncharacterized membrane protein